MSDKSPLVVAVVGGGAAGLISAISASRLGSRVIVLERLDRVGKKILATGNGRCNLTNTDLDIGNFHGSSPVFARSALTRFDFFKTMDFFEGLGIACKVEEGGKVYPFSDQASSVLDVLRHELDILGVKASCGAAVTDINGNKDNYTLHLEDGSRLQAHRVVIATGGRAAPSLGSNGSGYRLAEKLGHKLVDPFPALVQLRLAAPFLKQIKGVKFIGTVEVLKDKEPLASAAGEILFTEYGISGPPVLSISRTASELIKNGEKAVLKVCFIEDKCGEELEAFLCDRLQKQSGKTLSFSFVGFINKRLIPVILKEAGIADLNKPAGQVTAMERKSLAKFLQDWRFMITGTNSWQSAQVTAGGIDVRDINRKTMESRLVPGIYFAGEVMDIDGSCGGYNLQWAWSSGFIAGESAATA